MEARFPIIFAAGFFSGFVAVLLASMSLQSCHCEYGISKLPVSDSYAACLGSGSTFTIASTIQPGIMVLRGREGVLTILST